MNKVDRSEWIRTTFPTDDVTTWNDGVWPPALLRKRWQALFECGLHASHPGPVPERVAAAAALADHALRLELERGLY